MENEFGERDNFLSVYSVPVPPYMLSDILAIRGSQFDMLTGRELNNTCPAKRCQGLCRQGRIVVYFTSMANLLLIFSF
jgi:hypothetical protein